MAGCAQDHLCNLPFVHYVENTDARAMARGDVRWDSLFSGANARMMQLVWPFLGQKNAAGRAMTRRPGHERAPYGVGE